MAEKCEMIIGYLVPHRCENPSLGSCVKCGRGFCDEHTNATREGRLCLACAQGLEMPVALPIAAAFFTPLDFTQPVIPYAGRSMLELSLPMGLGIAAAVALIASSFAIALLGSDRADVESRVDLGGCRGTG